MSIDGPNKSKRGRPPVDSEAVKARFERRLLDAIDAYASQQYPPASRPEAVRVLVADQLSTLGLLPPKDKTSG